MTMFEQTIAALETELRHRERANPHLKGIPQIQNLNRIARIYDELVDLHLRAYEAPQIMQETNL